MKKMLNEILAANCNQDIEKVTKDTDRDYIMAAEEAKEYGLVDRVVAKKPANINPEN
jgi:ATP-dependent Clp protease protease subunit